MDPILVLSPHLDDAALSCGQMLAGYPDAVIATFFCGFPAEERTTTFDVNSGFANSTAAITARNHEDDRALAVLRARAIRGAFVDNQYRLGGNEQDPAEIRDQLRQMVSSLIEMIQPARLFAPLGLLHPDHELLSDATVDAKTDFEKYGDTDRFPPTWLYEELPTRVVEPDSVWQRKWTLYERLHRTDIEFVGTGPLDVKQEAVSCYTSQLWALDEHVIYVPERFHRLSRA